MSNTLSNDPKIFSIREVNLLKRKAVSGLFILGVRRVCIQLVLVLTNVIIARILFPYQLGIFIIISFFIGIFMLFADLGFEAAVIQRDNKPTTQELQSIFTAQFFLGLAASILMIFLSPVLFHLYKNQFEGVALFYIQVSSFAVFLFNLKSIPHALLERSMNYRKLLIGEVSELMLLQIVTILLAIFGFGFASFIWAMLVSRFVSAFVYFFLCPWPIRFRFSGKELYPFVSFGLSYQLNSIIGTVGGAFGPVVVGGIVGTTALGLVSWAGGVAALPRVVTELAGRLVFALCSRIQHDKKLLKRTFDLAIRFVIIFSFPMTALMIALARPITYIIFTDKWIAGVPVLMLFSFYTALTITTDIMMQMLMAVGKMKAVRNINLIWTIAHWVIGIPLVLKFGLLGMPLSWIAVSAFVFLPYVFLKKIIRIDIARDLITYTLFSCITGIAAFYQSYYFPIENIWGLIGIAGISIIIYAGLIFIFQRKKLMKDIKDILAIYSFRFNK